LIDHRYTIREIEEMRSLVHKLLKFRNSYWSSAWLSHGYNPQTAEVEEHLRTYMMTGIRPDELKKRAQEEANRFYSSRPPKESKNDPASVGAPARVDPMSELLPDRSWWRGLSSSGDQHERSDLRR
jgi:3'-phosphoadenosine 5'-phosphosulfate sulfotransferase (PAPS reductase)/FAD synthetase